MAIDENKQKALAAALGQIEKQFGKGSIMRLGEDRSMDVETISTGSLSLDIALGAGGLPMGRIVEIYGPESSGKTTLAIHAIAEAQKSGGIAAFIDAEHAFDRFYAEKLGRSGTFFPLCSFCPGKEGEYGIGNWAGVVGAGRLARRS